MRRAQGALAASSGASVICADDDHAVYCSLETNFVYLWGGYVLLQCSKCKAEAYCCKACQVGDPGAPAAHSAPYASARSPAPAPFPPACTPPPPDCRVEGRRPVRAFVQARKSASAELGHRRPWPDAPPASSSSRWRRPSPPPPSGSCSVLMMGIRSGFF